MTTGSTKIISSTVSSLFSRLILLPVSNAPAQKDKVLSWDSFSSYLLARGIFTRC